MDFWCSVGRRSLRYYPGLVVYTADDKLSSDTCSSSQNNKPYHKMLVLSQSLNTVSKPSLALIINASHVGNEFTFYEITYIKC